MRILAALALLLACAHATAAPEWQCDFKGTRAGREGSVIWAYCFGQDGDTRLIRQRVILPGALTGEAISDAKSWALTGKPDLFARPTSDAAWSDPNTATARGVMAAAIEAERKAGTMPPLKFWRVAPNPASTTTPPSRPMFDATGAKSVGERAIVGSLCNCSAPIVKGTQTLCPLRQFGDVTPTTNVAACVRQ